MTYSHNNTVFYRGPSQLTGDEIVALVLGKRSTNSKTGPVIQSYVLRADMDPIAAVRSGGDRAICGDCALRGNGTKGRTCYVQYHQAAHNIYKTLDRADAMRPEELARRIAGEHLRLCAYGDPAAVPLDTWRPLLEAAPIVTGFTHQWRNCDQDFRSFLMASVESKEAIREAQTLGWRWFRMRRPQEPLEVGEIACPASAEAGKRTTCIACRLCRGMSLNAKSIAIVEHGSHAMVFRSRREAEDQARTASGHWREKFKVHPAADVFPMLTAAEIADLAADIAARGLLELPVMWRDRSDGTEYVIDGRNRLQALEQQGRLDHVQFRTIPSDECPNPGELAVSLNIRRRHLSAAERARLAAEALQAGGPGVGHATGRKVARLAGVGKDTAIEQIAVLNDAQLNARVAAKELSAREAGRMVRERRQRSEPEYAARRERENMDARRGVLESGERVEVVVTLAVARGVLDELDPDAQGKGLYELARHWIVQALEDPHGGIVVSDVRQQP